MGIRSNWSDMRWWAAFLFAVLLVGCGGGKGLSRTARLYGGHYRFGPRLATPEAKTEACPAASDPGFPGPVGPIALAQAVSGQTPTLAACGQDGLTSAGPTSAHGIKTWPRTAQEPGIPEQTFSEGRIEEPRPVQEEGDERTKWNLFAVVAPILFIAALAIAIPAQSTELLLIGCALAFASAFIGARQCRERGERGQGFAMAVIGFALVGVLLATIALLSR